MAKQAAKPAPAKEPEVKEAAPATPDTPEVIDPTTKAVLGAVQKDEMRSTVRNRFQQDAGIVRSSAARIVTKMTDEDVAKFFEAKKPERISVIRDRARQDLPEDEWSEVLKASK